MDKQESPPSPHQRNQSQIPASQSLQISKQISKETYDRSIDFSTSKVLAELEGHMSNVDDRDLIENLEDKPNNKMDMASAIAAQPKLTFGHKNQDKIQEHLNRSKSGTLSDSSNLSNQMLDKHSGLEDEDELSVTNEFQNADQTWRENKNSNQKGFLTNPTEKRLPSSLMNVFGDEKNIAKNVIPEAMPLIRRISLLNQKEPDMYRKAQRGQTYSNIIQEQKEPSCEHDGVIDNWKCSQCKANISKFSIVFDDMQGAVNTFTRIVYENQFLQDFKQEFKSQAAAIPKEQGETPQPVLIYQSYQPNNILELKEYMFMIMSRQIKKVNKAAKGETGKSSPFGSGLFQNLSGRLLKYLMQQNEREKRLKLQYGKNILLFDSKFESGNLLQAEKCAISPNSYNLFMQVDTNTRGHQQWFYFKVKGGTKGKTYTFNIMNFTKPGVTGGRGYKSGEHNMRIMVKSKKQQIEKQNFDYWENITNEKKNCEYVKTNVARRKKDVIAAGADSDQEDWVEEAFSKPAQNPNSVNGQTQAQLPVINVNGPDQNQTKQNGGEVINPVPKEKSKKRKVFYYYALKFQYEFKYDDDSVYFSFSQPVTYTEILGDIHNRERNIIPRSIWQEVAKDQSTNQPIARKPVTKAKSSTKIEEENKQSPNQSLIQLAKYNQFQKNVIIENPNRVICYQRTEFSRTLSGLPLYKIVISRDHKSMRKNQIVLITSRVHSGESPGSLVFKGIFDFLTSEQREAKYLRRFYTFILIPCMNPDGVICGNYRNSLAGVDLNRQWINPEPEFHPEVWAVKKMMQKIKEEDKRQIWIFCDLHGHSKKKNSFFYGCNTAANGGFLSWTIVRLLPRIFAKKTHMFNYKDCKFRVEPYKIGTARIVAWKQFQITHSFTLENSFYGFDIGEDDHRIYTHENYKSLGFKFCISIYEMHYLWKQIKRELQVTHGWLKPRTLNQMTGVPAAQILAEEAAQLKEEERKKKAIEQYEQFLDLYYKNNKDGVINRNKFIYKGGKGELSEKKVGLLSEAGEEPREDKSRNRAQAKTLSEEQESPKKQMSENKKSEKQSFKLSSRPSDLEKEDEQQNEFMFKMHLGLVKIQALIRGFLERKKFQVRKKSKGETDRLKRQRSNQILKNSSSKKFTPQKYLVETSSDGQTDKVNNDSENILRSNTEQYVKPKNLQAKNQDNLSGKNAINGRFDWREYFEGDELDKAYQIVEVEQRDESDNDSDNMGSNSNPSEDNFDEEEVYRNVYGVENPQILLEQRKQKEEEFKEQVAQEVLTQEQVLSKLFPKPDEGKNEVKPPISKQKQKMLKIKKTQVSNNNLDKTRIESSANLKLSNQSTSQPPKADDSSKEVPYSQAFPANDSLSKIGKNQSIQNLQKSANHSPKQNELQQENLFSNINYQGIRRMIKSSNQQRAITQQQPVNQNGPNSSTAAKNGQLTYKLQQFNHKKENINQVIKDCFITKKMTTKISSNPRSVTKNSNVTVSPQKPVAKKQNNKVNLKLTATKQIQSLPKQVLNKDIMIQLGQAPPGKYINFNNLTQKQQVQLIGQIQKQPQYKPITQLELGPVFVHGQPPRQISSQQYMNQIQESVQQQNMYLLQHIVQNNINQQQQGINQTIKRRGGRQIPINAQLSQTKMNELLTNQFLAKINRQIAGLNALQTNQFLQLLLTQQIQQQQLQEEFQSRTNTLNKDLSGLSGAGLFYPEKDQENGVEVSPPSTDNSHLAFDQPEFLYQDPVKLLNIQEVKKKYQSSPLSTNHAMHRYSVAGREGKAHQQTDSDSSNFYTDSKHISSLFYKSGQDSKTQNFIGEKPPSAQAARKHSFIRPHQVEETESVQGSIQNQHSSMKIRNFTRMLNDPKNEDDLDQLKPPYFTVKCGKKKQSQRFDDQVKYPQLSEQHQSRLTTKHNMSQAQSHQNLGSSMFQKYSKKKVCDQDHLPPAPGAEKGHSQLNQQNVSPIKTEDYRDRLPKFLNQVGGKTCQFLQTEQTQNIDSQEIDQSDSMGEGLREQIRSTVSKQICPTEGFQFQIPPQYDHQIPRRVVGQDQTILSQEIVNTKELLNEIKQMRVHQQQQIQLQKQLQYQLQKQMELQRQAFIIGQHQPIDQQELNSFEGSCCAQSINSYGQISQRNCSHRLCHQFLKQMALSLLDQQSNQQKEIGKEMPLSQFLLEEEAKNQANPSLSERDIESGASDINQGFLQTQQAKFLPSEFQKDQIQMIKHSATEKKKSNKVSESKQVALEAADKIPVGLQALINKQQPTIVSNPVTMVIQQRKTQASSGKQNLISSSKYSTNPKTKSKKGQPVIINSDIAFQSNELTIAQKSAKKESEGLERINCLVKNPKSSKTIMSVQQQAAMSSQYPTESLRNRYSPSSQRHYNNLKSSSIKKK